jgi:hypothetical protein
VTRMLFRLLAALIVVTVVSPSEAAGAASAQIDPDVRDRVLPAVQVGLLLAVAGNEVSSREILPVGSGTIVSPNWVSLTDWHVVDVAAHQTELEAWEAHASEVVVLLSHEGCHATGDSDHGTGGCAEPAYLAQILAQHHALDFAIPKIVGDADDISLTQLFGNHYRDLVHVHMLDRRRQRRRARRRVATLTTLGKQPFHGQAQRMRR